MTKKTKALIAGAAIAGLLTGSSARVFAGGTDSGKPGVKSPGIEKMGCGGKSGCGGKNGCKGKESCKGKNDCKGKGGCKSGDNGCKGKNSCKGKGGCNASMPKDDKPKGDAPKE